MILRWAVVAWLLAAYAAGLLAAEPGPVAHYTFQEAAGTVLKDRSGNGRDGQIHNADWVRSTGGPALSFGSDESYVDCGLELGRQLAGDMTVLAWVKLSPASYPDSSTNWTLLDYDAYPLSGFMVRIDGQTTKLYYRANSGGRNVVGRLPVEHRAGRVPSPGRHPPSGSRDAVRRWFAGGFASGAAAGGSLAAAEDFQPQPTAPGHGR